MKKNLYILIFPFLLFLTGCVGSEDNDPILSIGDSHEGGIIFYLDENGGGLIAANEDLEGTYEWGCFLTQVEDGGNLTQIGTGYQNTLDIINQQCLTEFGGIPANTSSNSNQSDVNFVVPGAADSGNTYTVIAEFIKNYD